MCSWFDYFDVVCDENCSLKNLSIVLAFYDYLLTLPKEIRHYWGKSLNLSIFLFYANRYLILLCQVISLLNTFVKSVTNTVCILRDIECVFI